MKHVAMILGSVIFSIATVHAADIAKDAQEKIEKWQDGFMNVCQNAFEKEAGAQSSKEYCLCIVDSHKNYILGKIKEGEKIDVDEHLKELKALYQNSSSPVATEDDDEAGEPSMADIDIDLSKACLDKLKSPKAKKEPAKK